MSLLPCPKHDIVDCFDCRVKPDTRPTPAPLDGEPVRPERWTDEDVVAVYNGLGLSSAIEHIKALESYADKLLALRHAQDADRTLFKKSVDTMTSIWYFSIRVLTAGR